MRLLFPYTLEPQEQTVRRLLREAERDAGKTPEFDLAQRMRELDPKYWEERARRIADFMGAPPVIEKGAIL